MPLSDSVTMHLVCIVFYTALIATATALSSTSNPDDPYGYYDSDIDTLPPEQGADQGDDAAILPRFITLPATIVGKEGEPTILDCATENSERYGLVWQKDKETVAARTAWSKDPAVYQLYSNDSLLIKSVKSSTAGLYSCIVKITSTQNITLTHRVKLENAAEIISLHAENNATQLYTGDTLKLTCEVEGKPKPVIKWYFDRNDGTGAIEIQNQDHQSTGFKDTLIINGVSFKNNGTYRCLADNTKTADHKTIAVEVFDEPVHLVIKKLFSKNGELKGLRCVVKFNKITVNRLLWQTGSISHLQGKRNTSLQLNFEDIGLPALGIYTCLAESDNGVVENTLHIQPPSRAIFEKFITSETDKFNITLSWKIVSDFPITECLVYDVFYNEYSPIPYVSFDIHENKPNIYYILHSQYLRVDALYGFTIMCKNTVGWSEKSNTRILELRADLLYIEIEKLYIQSNLVGLACKLLLNQSEVNLSWEKVDNEVSSLDASLEYRNQSLNLLFNNSKIAHPGEYVCIAKAVNSTNFLKKYITIEPPSIPEKLETLTSFITWKLYSSLPITDCKVQYGNANAFGPLDKLDREVDIRREGFENYFITYRPPPYLKGNYEFTIACKNEDGWSETAVVQKIEFGVAPTVRIQKIYSKSKTVIGLDCIVQSSPLANIFWKRNGEILTSNNTLRRTKTSLKLILDDVDESDFGKYTCIAKNFVNTTEKDVLFVKPLQPQFRGFGTSASTGNDILTWTMISPVSIKHCMVYYKAENDTRHSIAATSVTKYEDGYMITYVPTVPNDGTYKFKVKCLSEAGWSDESLERNLGIKDKGRDSATSDSQISGGFRLLPSGMLFIAAAVLMNP